jgi:ketosteroid isomerase-like protein
MYHTIVKRIVHRGFQRLSQGDYEAVLKQFSPKVRFSFLGDHALGGECYDKDGVRQWFQRLVHVFPGLQFTIVDLAVSGWPWNTVVVNHFTVKMTYPDGRIYQNRGLQFVRLRWGAIVEDYVYEDTQKLAAELNRIGQQGLHEALATPIVQMPLQSSIA